jgi:hypothetical protein
MNNNVVPINRGRSQGQYTDARNYGLIADDASFFARMSAVVCPLLVYGIYGGPVPPVVLAGVVLAGSVWGLSRFYRFPDETRFRARTGIVPQALPSEDTDLKKAA